MTSRERENATSTAHTVISRRKIFDPVTVSLAELVLQYEQELSEVPKTATEIVGESA